MHEMPVDQHCLLATMAPRPFYVSNAAPVYKLFGQKVAFKTSEQPPINQAIVESSIGYHVRSGVHGLELYDLEKYMQFIEYHFMKIPIRSVQEVYDSVKDSISQH